MAKQGVSVKELAKELGLTSQQVLDRCRIEGVAVQNSITKLSARQEQAVRAWFRKNGPKTPEKDLP